MSEKLAAATTTSTPPPTFPVLALLILCWLREKIVGCSHFSAIHILQD